MKAVIHKILAFGLASIVLLTTMSFTVDLHYCGDALIDFSLNQKAETCGMENPQSENECENEISKKTCCSDKQIIVEGQEDLKLPITEITFEQQVFVAAFIYAYINLFDGLENNFVPFRDYVPPYLIRDVQKLHERYLI